MVRRDRSVVAVVGLGKIGLPLAVQYAQHGWTVIGCDVNPRVVEAIGAGQSHVQEEPELIGAVPELVRAGRLSATTQTMEAVRQADVVVVIVPVMVSEKHEVDFRAIDAATAAIGEGLQVGTLVTYETTLPVGTTSQRFAEALERISGLKAGEEFFLAYSPERVSSGHIFRDLRNYPKVIGGVNERSAEEARRFYQAVLDAEIIMMASADEAEFVKLIETTYRDVNIALANEFARFADLRGLNVASAISAANTQPYSHIHTPGVGVGGHCIPVYPYFLLAGLEGQTAADNEGELLPLSLPRDARRINDAMAEYAVQRLQDVIGSLAQQPVLLLGVAYRGNVREVAFTSAKLLQQALQAAGAEVYTDDPLFSEDELRALGYTPFASERAGEIRAIVLQADHLNYQTQDFGRFPHCQVVLDGRRALRPERVEAAGMQYIAIGDGHRGTGAKRDEGRHSLAISQAERGRA